MKQAELGSISSATMRSEDLIPVFIDALWELNPEKAKSIQKDIDKLKIVEKPGYGEYYDETDDIDGLSSMELASYIINEDLFDALNECAPPYAYFGSHPGNGSDYGFWPDTDGE